MFARKTSKNRITLPKALVSRFPCVDYYDVSTDGDTIVLRPVLTGGASAVWAKLEALGIKQKDITDAVRWARRRR